MGCKVALFCKKVKKLIICFRLLDFFADWSNWAPLQTGKDFPRPSRGCFAIVWEEHPLFSVGGEGLCFTIVWEGHPVTQKGTISYRGLTGT
mgnify:CR=1 FL=1